MTGTIYGDDDRRVSLTSTARGELRASLVDEVAAANPTPPKCGTPKRPPTRNATAAPLDLDLPRNSQTATTTPTKTAEPGYSNKTPGPAPERDRDRRGKEPWTGTGACYKDDHITHAMKVGFAITKKMVNDIYGGSSATMVDAIAAQIVSANQIYTMQLNIHIVAGYIYESTSGKETWDNPDKNGITCGTIYDSEGGSDQKGWADIDTQLDRLSDWKKPKEMAMWHLFDNCYDDVHSQKGPVGLAYIGVLCWGEWGYNGATHNGYNTGVDYYVPHDPLHTFDHALGHNMGAGHSFEDGQGSTGGVMDYGNKLYNGVYQFNTEYRKAEVCASIEENLDYCSDTYGSTNIVYKVELETTTTPPSTTPTTTSEIQCGDGRISYQTFWTVPDRARYPKHVLPVR